MFTESTSRLLLYTIITVMTARFKPTNSSKCDPIYEILPNPYVCCNYPRFVIPRSIVNKCTWECEQSTDSCCSDTCVPEMSETFVDGKLNTRKVKEYFANGIDSAEKGRIKILWKLIIRRAVEECTNKFRPTRSLDGCMPQHYQATIECVKLEIFLYCPNYNQTETCEDIRENLKKCDRDSRIF